MRISPTLAEMATYPFVRLEEERRRLEADGVPVIDFGKGDPNEPTDPRIRQALVENLTERSSYPLAQGLPELRAAVARWCSRRFGVTLDPDTEIVPTLGSKEAIFSLAQVLVDPRSEKRLVAYTEPGYPVYERGALFAGAEPLALSLRAENDFLPDLDAVDDDTWRRTAILWVNYPNNPTGARARDLPAQAGDPRERARTTRVPPRGEQGWHVSLGRDARRSRAAPARARRRRLARRVLRAVRRRLRPLRARADGRGVSPGCRDPRGGAVTDVEATIAALDRGELRVAEKVGGEWRVNEEAKQAILDYFRLRDMEPIEVGPFEYLDKIPLKRDYARLGVRVVPPATARYGSFLSPGVVMMPSYVNIGAWVGPRTMVDTWATVGSCAQIGADVHLAGGVGIRGAPEPRNAPPVSVSERAVPGAVRSVPD